MHQATGAVNTDFLFQIETSGAGPGNLEILIEVNSKQLPYTVQVL
jgi:hypothetical protein